MTLQGQERIIVAVSLPNDRDPRGDGCQSFKKENSVFPLFSLYCNNVKPTLFSFYAIVCFLK